MTEHETDTRREGVEAADDTGMVRQQELLVEADLEDTPGGPGEADDE
jgi:hypothetical protein